MAIEYHTSADGWLPAEVVSERRDGRLNLRCELPDGRVVEALGVISIDHPYDPDPAGTAMLCQGCGSTQAEHDAGEGRVYRDAKPASAKSGSSSKSQPAQPDPPAPNPQPESGG